MIWVLTAGFGDGHNTAAKSAAEALRHLRPDLRVEVTDLLDVAHPQLAGFLQSLYRFIIVTCPSVWRWIYQAFARPGVSQNAHWLGPVLRAMEHKLRTDPPAVIVSTFPLYSGILAVLRSRGLTVPPIITVITDSITVHPSWTAALSDQLCVPDQETLDSVLQLGVARQHVHITGFPVALAFTQPAPVIPRTVPRVLYMPSTSTGHVTATLRALLPFLKEGVHITLLPGRHASRLHHTLRQFLDTHPGLPLEVIGWTDQMPRLLQTHDLLICKAGGAILHEALAACIPAIIDYVVPGQEEGNADLLLNHHAGLRSHSPTETADQLRRMLDHNAALTQSMRAAMQPLSVPDAALRVAHLALGWLDQPAAAV